MCITQSESKQIYSKQSRYLRKVDVYLEERCG